MTNGATTHCNSLYVTGVTGLSNTLTVASNVTASCNLSVGGILSAGTAALSNTTFYNTTTACNALNVFGLTTISNALNVTSNLVVSGTGTFSNGINVVGGFNLSSLVVSPGQGTFCNGIMAISNSTFCNALNVFGVATVSNNLVVSGTGTFCNGISVGGAFTLNSLVVASGQSTFCNNVLALGATTISNALSVTSNLLVGGIASFSNSINAARLKFNRQNSNIFINNTSSDVIVASCNLFVNGSVSVSNSINASRIKYNRQNSNIFINNTTSDITVASCNLLVNGSVSVSNGINAAQLMFRRQNTSNVIIQTTSCNLTVNGTGTFLNGLFVNSNATFSNNMTVNGTLSVNSGVTISNSSGLPARVVGGTTLWSGALTGTSNSILGSSIALFQAASNSAADSGVVIGNLNGNLPFITEYRGTSNAVGGLLTINAFSNLQLQQNWNTRIQINSNGVQFPNGNVNIGLNSLNNKLLVLWDNNSSDPISSALDFYGFGINGNTLRYQSPVGGTHKFYSSSTLIATMQANQVSINGSLSKSSGTFQIQHPTLSNKHLIHSFIEGPRCDLIYRGKVSLCNGIGFVNLDKDCTENSNCSMTEGTFVALCANPQMFLQNITGYSALKGSIVANTMTITSQDSNCSDMISWMVIAERKDNFIKTWDKTDENGFLITEHAL